MSQASDVRLLDSTADASQAEDASRSGGKTRVQFELPPRSMKILAELKEKTDATSYAEVFKNALKLYDGIISEVEQGREFLIRDAAGQITAFRMSL